ncbi:MBL fold metallo-hydrolase [Egicoccus sp. AB-alg6-2]|uniref:MBL fold metallo-hydrolase n=1 Tax=Egicoccus sp. AB-alg6-2 TaxID=3242692 RepID=UPI00359D506C
MQIQQLSEHLYRFEDTCNVYVIRAGTDAVLIDFGSGAVLQELPEIGVSRVTDVLMTHHHRDQGQGLPLATAAGARIWVPHAEQELFDRAEQRWLARDVANNYNTREDRFSLVTSIPIDGTFVEYVPTSYGEITVTAIPLPGHTVGSVGFLATVDGVDVAFTGDLLAGHGKVWSLAATQWSYAGPEGLAMTWLSLMDVRDRAPDVLLPSHGPVMDDPVAALEDTAARVRELLDLRNQHLGLTGRRDEPFESLSPHLLYNRSSHARSYVLLSESGKALVVDFGYDFEAGLPAGTDRAARRPWLYTVPALKRQFGVTSIDVAIPTHYHDDHVAGFELLRRVEGTEVWGPENFVDVLQRPRAYDLPCLWYDPIEVDRVVPLEQPLTWEEYEIVLHPLPGHTLYAVAIEIEVDGRRVVATGDQIDDHGRLNYVYQNRFSASDYRVTADLFERIRPDLLLTGHWGAIPCDDRLVTTLKERGRDLERLHRDLLPLDDTDFDAEGRGLWVRPYHTDIVAGQSFELEVEVRNPAPEAEEVEVALVVPDGWQVKPPRAQLELEPGEHGFTGFWLTSPAGEPDPRVVVAADLTVAHRRYGQIAEALVHVR